MRQRALPSNQPERLQPCLGRTERLSESVQRNAAVAPMTSNNFVHHLIATSGRETLTQAILNHF